MTNILRNFAKLLDKILWNFQVKFCKKYSGEIMHTKMMQNLAKFTLKNFAFFLIAVRIEAGEILPHITFPFGILDRFYYLKEII